MELKQRICQFSSLEDVKTMRLVCREMNGAASPYLLNRIFVFNRPDNFEMLDTISDDPIFNKILSTIVWSPSSLYGCPIYRMWLVDCQQIDAGYSSDFVLSEAEKDFYEDNPYSEKFLQAKWNRYHSLWQLHRTMSFERMVAESLTKVCAACPNLTHLVLDVAMFATTTAETKQKAVFEDMLLPEDEPSRHLMPSVWTPTIQKILEVSGHADRAFSCLTFVDTFSRFTLVDTFSRVAFVASDTFSGLKHLRIISRSTLENAPVGNILTAQTVETLQIRTAYHISHDRLHTTLFRNLHSDSLRYCRLSGFLVSEDDLVFFLLRHATSLQYLSLCNIELETCWLHV